MSEAELLWSETFRTYYVYKGIAYHYRTFCRVYEKATGHQPPAQPKRVRYQGKTAWAFY